jgi:hypothetical protein
VSHRPSPGEKGLLLEQPSRGADFPAAVFQGDLRRSERVWGGERKDRAPFGTFVVPQLILPGAARHCRPYALCQCAGLVATAALAHAVNGGRSARGIGAKGNQGAAQRTSLRGTMLLTHVAVADGHRFESSIQKLPAAASGSKDIDQERRPPAF